MLEEIRRRLENEKRSPAELFNYLKQAAMTIFVTRRLNSEQVISCCVALIAMHDKLNGE